MLIKPRMISKAKLAAGRTTHGMFAGHLTDLLPGDDLNARFLNCATRIRWIQVDDVDYFLVKS